MPYLCLMIAFVHAIILACWWQLSMPPLSPLVEWPAGRHYEFGVVAQHQPVQHTFAFRNTGPTPVTVEVVRTTCGCTAARWTETPVAPNQLGEIVVEYDAAQQGAFHKRIRVFFKEIKRGVLLDVRGVVE